MRDWVIWVFPAGLAAYVLLVALALAIMRYMLFRGWHERWQHSCGNHVEHGVTGLCKKCGEPGEWNSVIARATFFGGWEFKEKQ